MTLTEEQIAEIRARVMSTREESGDQFEACERDRETLLSALEAANKRADEAEGVRTVRQERIEKLEARLLDVLATIRLREETIMHLTTTAAAYLRRAEAAEAELTRLREGNERLRNAAKNLLDRMIDTYKSRNGRDVSIEADDGEKCWIVHIDEIFALELALKPTAATQGGCQ